MKKKLGLLMLLLLMLCMFTGCKTAQRKDLDLLDTLQKKFAIEIENRDSAIRDLMEVEASQRDLIVYTPDENEKKLQDRVERLKPITEEGTEVIALYSAYLTAQDTAFSEPTDLHLQAAVTARNDFFATYNVLYKENSGIKGFIDGFRYEFSRNLITEDRWQLIINGFLITVEVSLISIVAGTLLGALFCLMRISSVKVLSKFAGAYIDIIRGTPSVIQLLIIYYGVFASVNVDKVIVASIAFAVNSSGYIAEIFRAGVLSVNQGQHEAGRSLGFSKAQTMLYIILPQALKNALPAYANEFITLIKETAIVGYVALNDLTKVCSMIQSRTFSPWFPLLTAALIYFVVTKLLALLFAVMERSLRKSDIR